LLYNAAVCGNAWVDTWSGHDWPAGMTRGGRMSEETQNSPEIKDTDIVFECPKCGKSLAIDYRGAGLSIPCTDCGTLVVVPIPEGMELSDLDTSEKDQAALAIHLRESLADYQTRVRLLEGMVEELKERHAADEQKDKKTNDQSGQLAREVEIIGKAVQEISASLARLSQITHQRPQ